MDWLTAIVAAVSLLAVFGVGYLIYYLYKKNKNSVRNVKDKASGALAKAKRFAAVNQFKIISPACIAKDGKFADIDFIVIGFFGVLGVKCNGMGGEIYGSAQDAMWLQVAKDKRNSFANPLLTAQSDARLVRDTLFAANIKNVSVDVVCVMTNKKASLALPRTTGHYTINSFGKYLTKEKFEQDKGVDLAKTEVAIKAWITASS